MSRSRVEQEGDCGPIPRQIPGDSDGQVPRLGPHIELVQLRDVVAKSGGGVLQVRTHDLQRDGAPERLLLGEVDRPHPALVQRLDDPIPAFNGISRLDHVTTSRGVHRLHQHIR